MCGSIFHNSYSVLWVIVIIQYCGCFVVQIASLLTTGSSFRLAPVPFIFFLSTSLFSDTTRYSILKLYIFFFCHKSGINHFSRESWFHCWRVVFRNQSLDTGCVHCYGDVIVSRSFQRTLLGNLCMPIRVYTYTCIYFCFCLPVFIF